MAMNESQLNRLLRRLDRALAGATVPAIIERDRAIIGPRPDLLERDAAAARQIHLQNGTPTARQEAALEQIVRLQRPAPPCVRDGLTQLPAPGNWLADRWVGFQPRLCQVQTGVARLDRIDDPDAPLGAVCSPRGTGFLVADDILMTAAHVVDELTFRTGRFEPGQAVADFQCYAAGGASETCAIVETIALDEDLDLALLRIDPSSLRRIPRLILMLSTEPVGVEQPICVVGHPMEDPRSPLEFTNRLFGPVYGVKRASIGEVLGLRPPWFSHDASTLGGNSGSPVFDLATGAVCGVHVSGRAMLRNEAVLGPVARDFVRRHLSSNPKRNPTSGVSAMPRSKPSFEAYLRQLSETDPEIMKELAPAKAQAESVRDALGPAFQLETIVLTKGRPVLDIQRGAAVVNIDEVESQIWKDRLQVAVASLEHHIPAVGRIELANHPRGVAWLGTGWVLRDDIIVTNRHVAEVFGEADGGTFVFRPGFDGTSMKANVDFLEEFGRSDCLEFPLFKIMHIERGGGPDLAFLRIEPVPGQTIPPPVPIASAAAANGEQVAVIGYPARDPYFPNPEEMDRIFHHRYDKKRLAPGLITGITSECIYHDCSTLGGNSGGEVVSLKNGGAVALHFAGTLFTRNHAVPIDVVRQRLDDVQHGRIAPVSVRVPGGGEGIALQARGVPAANPRVLEATIPLKIRVEIGDVTISPPAGPGAPPPRPAAPAGPPPGGPDDDLVETAEARPEDYRDRTGYDPSFLGDGVEVPLPTLTENRGDILRYQFDGERHDVLPYTHFSVLVSRSRRLCRFSACNVDGKTSKKLKRVGWKTDPRIPRDAQILKECYGNEPKFSRGHMTRREDPVWGKDADAELANADSMHVTNVVPQMQPFNAGIWLGLEDYALDHAREDSMRLCVFTGPFLDDEDPDRYGVKIPLEFWKVIAFIHDETEKLCATGYTMSQRSFLAEEEFIFRQHEHSQRPIAEIGRRAGLSFGRLADVDPLRDVPEAAPTLLTDFGQIRFV